MKLQIFKKDKLIVEQNIEQKPIVLGRADSCDLVIQDGDIARHISNLREERIKKYLL